MATIESPRQVELGKKYDTVVSSGQSALRAFLTLNGGATVAFLAFIGHAMETGKLPLESSRIFVGAMQLFIYGTFLAVLAYGTIFLTNCLSRIEWLRASNWMFGITLLCGFASLGCFLAASGQAVEGFQKATEVLARTAT
jgi:hypothetical protein